MGFEVPEASGEDVLNGEEFKGVGSFKLVMGGAVVVPMVRFREGVCVNVVWGPVAGHNNGRLSEILELLSVGVELMIADFLILGK